MNLEKLLSRFELVASRLEANNSNHRRLNYLLHNSSDNISDDCCGPEVMKEESEFGILVSLEKTLNYIEILSNEQEHNISITDGIIVNNVEQLKVENNNKR